MKVTVHFRDEGVLLTRENQNQIFIPKHSWIKFINLKCIVQQHLDDKKENVWQIGGNLKVSTSIYNDNILLHIRIWFQDHPTKQGVTLSLHEWNYIFSFLVLNKEEKMAVKSIQNVLAHDVKMLVQEQCEGCKNDWPSQKDHDCVMNPHSIAHNVIDDIFNNMDYLDYLMELSKVAQKQRVEVKRPFEMFQSLRMVKEDELKKNVLMEYQQSN